MGAAASAGRPKADKYAATGCAATQERQQEQKGGGSTLGSSRYDSARGSSQNDSFAEAGAGEDESGRLRRALRHNFVEGDTVADRVTRKNENAKLLAALIGSTDATEMDEFLETLQAQPANVRDGFTREAFLELRRVLQMASLAKELAMREDSKEQFSHMMRSVCGMVNGDRAVLYLCDNEHEKLRVQALRQVGARGKSISVSLTFPYSVGLSGLAVETGESVVVEDAYSDPRFSPRLDEATGYRTQSMLTVPLGYATKRSADNDMSRSESGMLKALAGAAPDIPQLGKLAESGVTISSKRRLSAASVSSTASGLRTSSMEVVGVLQVMNKRNGMAFTEDDVAQIEALVPILASYISHAMLREREKRERARKEAILEIASELGSSRNVHTLTQTIVRLMTGTFNADRCSIFFVNRQEGIMWTVLSKYALEMQTVTSREEIIRIPIDKGIAGHVAMTGEMVNLEDAYEDPRFNREVDIKTNYRTRSVLCGPIKNGNGEVVAVLQLLNKKADMMINFKSMRQRPSTGLQLGGAGFGSTSKLSSAGSIAYGNGENLFGTFNEEDEHMLSGMFSMIGVAISNMELFAYSLIAQNRLKCVLENVAELVLTVSKEGMLMGCNRSCAEINRLFGMDITPEEMRSRKVQDWLPDVTIANNLKEVIQLAENCSNERDAKELGVSAADHTLAVGNVVNYSIRPLVGVGTTFDNLIYQQRQGDQPSKRGRDIGLDEVLDGTDVQGVEEVGSSSSEEEGEEEAEEAGTSDGASMQSDGKRRGKRVGVLSAGDRFELEANNTTRKLMSSGGLAQGAANLGKGVVENKDSGDGGDGGDGGEGGEGSCKGSAKLKRGASFMNIASNTHGIEEKMEMEEDLAGDDFQELLGAVLCIDDKTPEQKLMSTLNKYLAPDLVDHLLTQDGKLQLGGVKQKVSILFSDIRGFTTLSESSEPSEVFHTLNEYFSCMVDVITRHGGIVDKFIGDALMAVFGVPKPTEEDSRNACMAALAMHQELEEFNKRRRAANKIEIKIGVGVSTGEVYCGNIGSENRFEYTVIGDSVNVASRLEASTKEYGLGNLVSASTFEDAFKRPNARIQLVTGLEAASVADRVFDEEQLFLREIDEVRVAGKEGTTRLYEVLCAGKCFGEIAGAQRVSAIFNYARGLEAYRKRDIDAAFELFEQAADDGDAPSALFEERCEHLLGDETWRASAWDGVWDMQKVSVWTYKGNTTPAASSYKERSSRRLSKTSGGDGGAGALIKTASEAWVDGVPADAGEGEADAAGPSDGEASPEGKEEDDTVGAMIPGAGRRQLKVRDRKRSIILKPMQGLGDKKAAAGSPTEEEKAE